MRKISFILFLFICVAARAEYDSTSVLACKQKYAIPENVATNDVVGTWLKTWTWLSGNAVTYTVETNWNNAFAINSSTGVITISDYTKINGKIVTRDTTINLIIRTTDAVLGYELDTAQIRVKENSYCKFYDLDNGTNGSGTKASPYNNPTTVAIQAGYGYFFKRGTLYENAFFDLQLGLVASAAHPVVFGAYGTGVKPIFSGPSGSNDYFCYMGDWDYPTTRQCEYFYFYDLHIRNYDRSAWYVKRISNHMGWYNCDITNCDKIGTATSSFVLINEFPDASSTSDSTRVYDFEILNAYFDTTGVSCTSGCEVSYIKGGTGTLIQNCYFGEISGGLPGTYQVRLCEGQKPIVRHCYFDRMATSSSRNLANIQLRTDDALIEDCIFGEAGAGIYVTDPGGYNEVYPDSLTVRNCHFYNHGVASISHYASGDAINHSVGNLYEDNYFQNVKSSFELRDVANSIIRRNLMVGTGNNGITTVEDAVNLSIYSNIIYGFSTNQIYLTLGSGHTIYNNTVVGAINGTGATETARNNFATAFTSIGTASNNIDMDTVLTSNFFTDYANHNYHLKLTADTAINKGYNTGIGFDYENNITPQGIAYDIGALEYVYSPTPPSTDYTLVDSIGVNFTGGTLLKYKWNNLSTFTAASSVALNYYAGTSTGATMTNTSGWEGYGDQGYISGYFPDTVQKSNFYSTASTYRNFVFSGLNNAHVYTFYVMGSRKTVGESPSRQIVFRINNDSTIVTTTDNASSLATFNYVYPTTGSITLKCRRYVGDYMYINGIMIREYIPPTTSDPKRILNRVIFIKYY